MMRDEDKPFICYKSRWSIQIKPRNAEGGKLLGLWMLAMVPQTGLFLWAMSTQPRPALVAVYAMFFAAAMGVWAFNMINWMKERSEIVDLDALREIKRKQGEAGHR